MVKNPLSRKLHLKLLPPSEQDPRADVQRICDAIGYAVHVPLTLLRAMPRILEDAAWDVTATLGWNGTDWTLLRLEPGDTTAVHFGVALDLGSTTVCMSLVDIHSGKILCSRSGQNEQIAFGPDILTRVFSCKNRPEVLEEIHAATIRSIEAVLAELEEQSGVGRENYSAMVAAGNTTMLHFFLGLDPFAVFASPYAPHVAKPDFYPAQELGLEIPGYVYCVPCRANYLGGDILSGMAATELPEQESISVFLDIGTNGELVVGNRDFLISGAGAAGPALEGGVVKTGMRAESGAVSRVTWDGQAFCVTTVDGSAPKGICGSGIVDLIAALLLSGKMDRLGRLRPDAPGVVELDGEPAVFYAPGLAFYQSDLDAFLRTKAAANTMVEYVLEAVGISMDQVAYFYVAGAFGTYLDKESAVTVGLYPDIPRERIRNAGNSSLAGAAKLLLDRDWIPRIQGYLDKMEYIQFGAVGDFVSRMTAAMAVPHMDMSRYPSVAKKLEQLNLI